VFTEAGAGSDLASLTTRATRMGGGWRITGAKCWITHAARSDLMTLLARTGTERAGTTDCRCSWRRNSGRDRMTTFRMSVSKEASSGARYRGMREYVLAFEDFRVGAEGLLGSSQGAGSGN